jgi:hypothetical protein
LLRLALNHSLPDLCLLSSWDYRHKPLAPGTPYIILTCSLPCLRCSTGEFSTFCLCPLDFEKETFLSQQWRVNHPEHKVGYDRWHTPLPFPPPNPTHLSYTSTHHLEAMPSTFVQIPLANLGHMMRPSCK